MKQFIYGVVATFLLVTILGFSKPKEYAIAEWGGVFGNHRSEVQILNDYALQGYQVKFAIYDASLQRMRVIMER